MVRQDELIGPIFNNIIEDRWSPASGKNVPLLADHFMDERTYQGTPFAPHAVMPFGSRHILKGGWHYFIKPWPIYTKVSRPMKPCGGLIKWQKCFRSSRSLQGKSRTSNDLIIKKMTMDIHSNSIIGEVVAYDFHTASVFSKHKIDFAANGKRSLTRSLPQRRRHHPTAGIRLKESLKKLKGKESDF